MVKVRMPKQLTCKRCGHSWNPRVKEVRVCPKCHTPYWDIPFIRGKRKRKVVKTNDKQGNNEKECEEGQKLA